MAGYDGTKPTPDGSMSELDDHPLARITRVSAYGLVCEEDLLLLCRISPRLPHLSGLWTLPGGGLEFREDPTDAMVREVREETGFVVQPGDLAFIHSNAVDTDHAEYHGIRIVYHTELIGGELAFETDGTTDMCRWWPRAELAQLLEQQDGAVDLVRMGAACVWPQFVRSPT